MTAKAATVPNRSAMLPSGTGDPGWQASIDNVRMWSWALKHVMPIEKNLGQFGRILGQFVGERSCKSLSHKDLSFCQPTPLGGSL